MKARILAAAGLAVTLAAAAGCGGSSNSADKNTGKPAGKTGAATKASDVKSITVWLQTDAQGQAWQPIVDAANQQFQQAHPGVTADVQYQDWTQHLTKLDAQLAARKAPDVVEFGNTETTKYMAEGVLADLTPNKGDFDNSSQWLDGLTQSCTYQGKLYCVPYYAGARGTFYRTDQFKAAGISAAPTTLDEFVNDCKALQAKYGASDPNYSGFYFPGKYWYGAMSFVYDYGGQIAAQDGDQWKAQLESSQAQQGLQKIADIAKQCSKAPADTDENHPDQGLVFAKGHVGMFYGPGWESGVILDPKKGNPKMQGKFSAFNMPSANGKPNLPAFLGGSDLAVMATSKAQDLARDWIKIYTGTQSETQLVQKDSVVPNAKNLTSANSNPDLKPFYDAAAGATWFVPTAKNWAQVEQANILPNMLAAIFSGKQSIADATKAADSQIDQILNGQA